MSAFHDWVHQYTAGLNSVLELGVMFGVNFKFVHDDVQIKTGIEIHKPYIDAAPSHHNDGWGYITNVEFIHGNATQYRELISRSYDGVMMIDFIEHLEKEVSIALIKQCQEDFKRILIWVPLGVYHQSEDIFHLGADEYQTHRSSWWPHDLEQLGFQFVTQINDPGRAHTGVAAVWNKE